MVREILIRKDGESAIANESGVGINGVAVGGLAAEHVSLREYGFHTAQISSGAVTEGIRLILALGKNPDEFDDKTKAMIGMPSHFNTWAVEAGRHGLLVASSLSTEIELVAEGKEIKGGMGEAIRHDDVLLVANYHDEADPQEMKIYRREHEGNILQTESSENDFHAANIAMAVGATILMLCTRANGFEVNGKKLDRVHVDDIDELLEFCRPNNKKNKKNDMRTKLKAAEKAARAGVQVVIGHTLEDSRRLIEDNAGTWVVQ